MNASTLTKADISDFRELARSSALRKECQLVVVEGFRAIDGAKRSGASVHTIFTTDEQDSRFDAYRNNAEIKFVTEKAIGRISTTPSPQNAIALCSMPIFSDQEFITSAQNKPIFVLDHVADPGNMGTIFRSAVAFGIGGVITLGGCDPFHPKVVRSSAGSLFGCPIYDAQEFELDILLKDRTIYVADAKGEAHLEDIKESKSPAIIFGSEAEGIITDFFQNNTVKFSIPMEELCESLNVAMTAAIVAHGIRHED